MMVCLIFHTAIITNRKNWRITMKLHFENLSIFFLKSERTQMLGPSPSPCSFLFAFQWLPPSLPSTKVFSEWSLCENAHSLTISIWHYPKCTSMLLPSKFEKLLMVWMDWHSTECIFQIHSGHSAIGPYNIQITLKGLHFKVFIFNVFIKFFKFRIILKDPSLSLG